MSEPDLTILLALRDTAPGNAMPEDQLFLAVNRASALPVSRLELKASLAALEQTREVFGKVTRDGTKWSILTNGEARLAEANL